METSIQHRNNYLLTMNIQGKVYNYIKLNSNELFERFASIEYNRVCLNYIKLNVTKSTSLAVTQTSVMAVCTYWIIYFY